jgi:hypothetical protein
METGIVYEMLVLLCQTIQLYIPRRLLARFKCYRMLSCVVVVIIVDVSNDCVAFTFRKKEVQNETYFFILSIQIWIIV